MTRTMDPAHFNRIGNDPGVRPRLGGEGVLDFTPLVEDPANVAFTSEHGGLLCVALGAGRYEVHTLVLERGRGLEAARLAHGVADYMFARTDCVEARTTVPQGNVAALALARACGFELSVRSRLPWDTQNSVEAGYYTLTLERWALTSAQTAVRGVAFHLSLAEALALVGVTDHHPPDPVHDRIVGATALMVAGGQAEKGVRFYNVWAQIAHYAPIQLLRLHPPVLDVADAIVSVTPEGALQILRCRERRTPCLSA